MPQMTLQTRAVLAEFLKDHNAELYGGEIKKATGLKPGTLYPILKRLEGAGWLTSRWQVRLDGASRRVLCYYTLTSEGWAIARQEAAIERSNIKRRRST